MISKKSTIPILLSLICLILSVHSLSAQEAKSEFMLVKAYPVTKSLRPAGLIVAVEKTIDTQKIGLQAAIKYFAGARVESVAGDPIDYPEYALLEIQGRYYPGRLTRAFYIAPSLSINNKAHFSAGAAIGAQKFIFSRWALDLNFGFRTAMPEDLSDFGLLLRIQAGLAFSLSKGKENE